MPSELPRRQAEDPAVEPGALYRAAWIFYLVLAIIGVIWIGTSQGEIPLSLFLDPGAWWIDVALGLAAALLLLGLWDLGRRSLAAVRELEDILAHQLGTMEPSETLVLALISGFAEELFFRGAVQLSWGPLWAVVIFTLLHTGRGWEIRYWTLFTFLAAVIFGALTWWRGNIGAAIVAHVVVNAVNLRRLLAVPASTDPEDRSG